MYHHPIKFFKRFLLLLIISVALIPISIGLLSIGTILGYIAVILILIDGILLFSYWLLSIYYLLRSFFDREITKGYVIRFLNVVFTTIVVSLIGIFYLYIILGLFVVLLPFLA